MSFVAYAALIGWVPFSIMLFFIMPRERAVLVTVLGGWLLLPISGFRLPGLPDYSKTMAIAIGVTVGLLLTPRHGPRQWRLSVFDIPVLVRCLMPMATSLSNRLGPYDGLSAVVTSTLMFGVPYFAGRSVFGSRSGARALLIGVAAAGLLYAPLCLFEIKMSPQLNLWIYGFRQAGFHTTARMGGYRPMVFLKHGIELGLFMSTAALACVWVWRGVRARRILGLNTKMAAIGMMVVLLLCRALNGWAAFLVGVATLVFSRSSRTTVLVLIVALGPLAYVATRVVLRWDAQQLVDVVTSIDADRAVSFGSRIGNEERMIEKVSERPWLGWGGWNRSKLETSERYGRGYVILDSMWIIELAGHGLIGLLSQMLILLLPALLSVRSGVRGLWFKPEHAAFAALATIPLLFALDGLANYMFAPVYVLCAGAAMTYVLSRPTR